DLAGVAATDRVVEGVHLLRRPVLHLGDDVGRAQAPALSGPLEELADLRREGRRFGVGARDEALDGGGLDRDVAVLRQRAREAAQRGRRILADRRLEDEAPL